MTTNPETNTPGKFGWAMALIPVIALVAVLAYLSGSDPLSIFTAEAPPIESLEEQRLTLDEEGFHLQIINSGPDPVTIAQVTVDEAYWHFSFEDGDATLDRLETATLHIPYPWVEGEGHEIVLLSTTGTAFVFPVEVALATPEPSNEQFRAYGILGFYVGIVPVVLGLLWYPFIRSMGRRWLNFILALTVGLLVFLAVDTLLEALEISAEAPATFQAQPLVYLLTLLTLLAILGVGKTFNKRDSKLFVSYNIALGIGLHNLGEGLAVGAAFAIGQVSLGTFLVIGFTLHNITEGIGIAAPIAKNRPALYHFPLLAILAGGPAIIGTWIGGFTFNPLYAVIFLSIGAGAILQVVYEVTRMILRDSQRHNETALSWGNIAGLALGIGIMYFTAFLVA